MKNYCCILVFLFVNGSLLADTLHVSPSGSSTAPYSNWTTAATNIQDAVDAASVGDTVLVGDGVYNSGSSVTPGGYLHSRVCIAKNITVRSLGGPTNTIIEGAPEPTDPEGFGSGAIRGVYLDGGDLYGFTISNGYTTTAGASVSEYDWHGGGLFLSSGEVSNMVFTGNAASVGGGATCFTGSITHCSFNNNSAQFMAGGLILGEGTASYCSFTDNSAQQGGGGILVDGLYDCCTFTNNTSSADGGAVVMYSGSMMDCDFHSNSATNNGGGIFQAGGLVARCLFTENKALSGGGAYIAGTNASTLTTCDFQNNSASNLGGGAYIGKDISLLSYSTFGINSANQGGGCYISDGSVSLCCFKSNSALSEGGAVSLSGGTLSFSSLAGNLVGTIRRGIYILDGKVTHCASRDIIDQAGGTIEYSCAPGIPSGTENISNDPSLNDDLSLRAGSPCIDAGDPTLTPEIPDFAGNPRTINNRVDMGAFEYLGGEDPGDSPMHYVAEGNGDSAWPYSSWETASDNIQDAVDAASADDTVLVSNGVYNTNSKVPPGQALSCRVCIDTNITVRSVNGPEVTFIEGAPGHEDDFDKYAVRCVYLDQGTLSGFTVTNGYTDQSDINLGGWSNADGGGLYMQSGSVKNMIFTGNCAYRLGGGVYMIGGTLKQSFIIDNSAGSGGGASLHGGTLSYCTFEENSAGSMGGATYMINGSLTRCGFNDNTSLYGGAVHINGGFLTFNRFRGNHSSARGGAAYMTNGSISQCSFVSNSSDNEAGGLYMLDGSLSFCSFSGNSADYSYGTGVGAICLDGTLEHCAFRDGLTYDSTNITPRYTCAINVTEGNGNIRLSPLFISWDDQNLQAGSPCINAGDPTISMAPPNDIAWKPRISIGRIDIGAYEYIPPSLDTDGDGTTDCSEYLAGTSVNNSNEYFRIVAITEDAKVNIWFNALSTRKYTLQSTTNLAISATGGEVEKVRFGIDGMDHFSVPSNTPWKLYSIKVEAP